SCTARLPTSTLFPYTTLFRSIADQIAECDVHPGLLAFNCRVAVWVQRQAQLDVFGLCDASETLHDGGDALIPVHWFQIAGAFHRSEEHTSELQSRENLVCRFL